MSREQLTHIFEPSACLTPRQMKGYVSGKMVHEECHAVEVHLLSCPMCSDAVDGLKTANTPAAIAAMDQLDDSFIAKHLGVPAQEIKQATKTKPTLKAGAYSTAPGQKPAKSIHLPWKPMALAASLIAAVCIMWFMRDNIFPQGDNDEIAEQIPPVENKPEPEVVYRPDTMNNEITTTDTIAIQEDIAQQEALAATAALEAAEKAVAATAKDTAAATRAKAILAKKEAEKKQADAKLAIAKKAEEDRNKSAELADNAVVTKTQPAATVSDERGRLGNSYGPANVNEYSAATQKDEAEAPPKKKIALGTARSGIPKGDDAFNDGKYKKALKVYQKVMYDPESNQKDAATIMAAKCHIAMDEMMQARTLLNSLVNENSTKKGEAKNLLNEVGE